jgi:Ca2+-binding EF-hand superfamily protein
VITRTLILGAAAAIMPTMALAAPTAASTPAAKSAPQPVNRAAFQANIDRNFQAIDTNKDGQLSSTELAVFEGQVQQRRIGVLRKNFEARFVSLDTNKDGQLTKAEFMAMAPTTSAAKPNGAATVIKLDLNKDGKVSIDEYRRPALANFDKADVNKDGVLSPGEGKRK